MENTIIFLTEADKAILNSYIKTAEGLADFLGDGCEIVVHDLSRLDSSVIKIINGHLSGRNPGAPISEVTLTFLNKMLADPNLRHVTYFAKNKRRETFKASISAITDAKNNIIGLFCLNFYLMTPMLSLMQTFTPAMKADHDNISETFVENTEELMVNALEEAKKAVYENLSISSSNKNKEIIAILHQKGIFNLKDSVITVANHLGISKNTVYMHIRNMNKL